MVSIEVIKCITLVFFILYLPRMWCWFASFKKQKRLFNDKKNKIAVVIPARNEGTAVIPLLETLKSQTYPREHFDVFIVVKDPADPVFEYARIADAKVYVDTKQTCKGDCLNSCFKQIMADYPKMHDAFIVVDADCTLESTFLEEMNNAMASGADIINAKKLVKNYFQKDKNNVNLVTSCNGLIWTLMDDMGNRWKSDHGYTTMTVTTGILFARKLVEEWNGWIYRETLTEDMELQRDCAVKGYKTFYYSYAKFYMEEAPLLSETNKRRTRWMTGLTNSDFIYRKRLFEKRGLYHFMNTYFIYCLWIVYAYIGTMLALFVLNTVTAGLAYYAQNIHAGEMFSAGLCALFAVYAAFFVLSVAAIIVDWDNIKLSVPEKVILAFAHPIFYMWYIKIVAKAIVIRTPQKWEEIERIESPAGNCVRSGK